MPPSARAVRRALQGFLTRPTILTGEVPEELRPSRRAVVRNGSQRRISRELHLLSYNLQRAHREPAMIRTLVEATEDHRPDVLLLQEAPRGLWLRPELAPVFAGRDLFYAPFHQVSRPGGRYRSREYGQLIASRFALEHTEVIELPTVTRAGLGAGHLLKRVALLAELPLRDGRRLRLINVHHEPFVWPAGRSPQHAALLRRLEEHEPQESRIDLCVGDFNALFGVRREPGLAEWWTRGFEPALPHGRHLDNALARGHRELRAAKLRKPGSDHRPLVVQAAL